ncbi:MAG: DMT family transporter [Liquorilactobacillus satsumensis]
MSRLQANLILIIVTFFWGASYVFMKLALFQLDALTILAIRFDLALLIIGLFLGSRFIKTPLKTVIHGSLLGLILIGVFLFPLLGLQTTTPSQAGFLISLTTIFVPIELWLFKRQRVTSREALAIGLALIGVSFLTLHGSLKSFNIGDLWCLATGVLYAGHIILTANFTRGESPLQIGIWQIASASFLSTIVVLLNHHHFPLPTNTITWGAVLGLGFLCTAVGFMLQPLAQKYTSPLDMGLIFSLEPLFSAGFSWLFFGELFNKYELTGAMMILTSILLMVFQNQSGHWISSRFESQK